MGSSQQSPSQVRGTKVEQERSQRDDGRAAETGTRLPNRTHPFTLAVAVRSSQVTPPRASQQRRVTPGCRRRRRHFLGRHSPRELGLKLSYSETWRLPLNILLSSAVWEGD